jgi:hypothetical protein
MRRAFQYAPLLTSCVAYSFECRRSFHCSFAFGRVGRTQYPASLELDGVHATPEFLAVMPALEFISVRNVNCDLAVAAIRHFFEKPEVVIDVLKGIAEPDYHNHKLNFMVHDGANLMQELLAYYSDNDTVVAHVLQVIHTIIWHFPTACWRFYPFVQQTLQAEVVKPSPKGGPAHACLEKYANTQTLFNTAETLPVLFELIQFAVSVNAPDACVSAFDCFASLCTRVPGLLQNKCLAVRHARTGVITLEDATDGVPFLIKVMKWCSRRLVTASINLLACLCRTPELVLEIEECGGIQMIYKTMHRPINSYKWGGVLVCRVIANIISTSTGREVWVKYGGIPALFKRMRKYMDNAAGVRDLAVILTNMVATEAEEEQVVECEGVKVLLKALLLHIVDTKTVEVLQRTIATFARRADIQTQVKEFWGLKSGAMQKGSAAGTQVRSRIGIRVINSV